MPLKKIAEVQIAEIVSDIGKDNGIKLMHRKINEVVNAYNALLDALRALGINV